jgi:ribosomal-protein-alanine N-acetyltransferase
VLERIGLELQWRGRSAHRDVAGEPSAARGTTHLQRVVYADRRLDDDTLDAVIALG